VGAPEVHPRAGGGDRRHSRTLLPLFAHPPRLRQDPACPTSPGFPGTSVSTDRGTPTAKRVARDRCSFGYSVLPQNIQSRSTNSMRSRSVKPVTLAMGDTRHGNPHRQRRRQPEHLFRTRAPPRLAVRPVVTQVVTTAASLAGIGQRVRAQNGRKCDGRRVLPPAVVPYQALNAKLKFTLRSALGPHARRKFSRKWPKFFPKLGTRPGTREPANPRTRNVTVFALRRSERRASPDSGSGNRGSNPRGAASALVSPLMRDGGRAAVAPVVRDMIVANESRIHSGDRREPAGVPAIAEILSEEGLGIRNGQAVDRGIDDPVLRNPGPELDVVVPRARGRRQVGPDPRCGGRGRLAARGNCEQHRGRETYKSLTGDHGSSR